MARVNSKNDAKESPSENIVPMMTMIGDSTDTA